MNQLMHNSFTSAVVDFARNSYAQWNSGDFHYGELTRRSLLKAAGCGFGTTALAAMLGDAAWASNPLSVKDRIFRPEPNA